MFNDIQKNLRELLELVRDVASYDATLSASQLSGNSIQPGDAAVAERVRKAARIVQIKQMYDL